MHRHDLTSFVFIAAPFLEPRNKGNRNTEFMLFILSHYYYLYLSRLCRWGRSKSGLIYKDKKTNINYSIIKRNLSLSRERLV